MTDQPAGVPPRISFITLGAADVRRLREFYLRWGWTEGPGGSAEAAPDLSPAPAGAWAGVEIAWLPGYAGV